jgi:hypothetical protein
LENDIGQYTSITEEKIPNKSSLLVADAASVGSDAGSVRHVTFYMFSWREKYVGSRSISRE